MGGGGGGVGGSIASAQSGSGKRWRSQHVACNIGGICWLRMVGKVQLQCNAKSQLKSLTCSDRPAMAHFQPLYVIATLYCSSLDDIIDVFKGYVGYISMVALILIWVGSGVC